MTAVAGSRYWDVEQLQLTASHVLPVFRIVSKSRRNFVSYVGEYISRFKLSLICIIMLHRGFSLVNFEVCRPRLSVRIAPDIWGIDQNKSH